MHKHGVHPALKRPCVLWCRSYTVNGQGHACDKLLDNMRCTLPSWTQAGPGAGPSSSLSPQQQEPECLIGDLDKYVSACITKLVGKHMRGVSTAFRGAFDYRASRLDTRGCAWPAAATLQRFPGVTSLTLSPPTAPAAYGARPHQRVAVLRAVGQLTRLRELRLRGSDLGSIGGNFMTGEPGFDGGVRALSQALREASQLTALRVRRKFCACTLFFLFGYAPAIAPYATVIKTLRHTLHGTRHNTST